MRMPNGYGSVIKMTGKRRKPYAVRTSYIVEENGNYKQKYKYHKYFEKAEHAYAYLAELNNHDMVPEHIKFTETPTFKEMYDKWKKYRKTLPDKISEKTWRNYDIACNHLSDLHHKKFNALRTDEIQACINKWTCKSSSTVSCIRTVLNNLYKYAVMNNYIEKDKDLSEFFVYSWSEPSEQIHSRYTYEEIEVLWANLYNINNVDLILITIYTGLRPTELLEITTDNVHIDEQYMVGGIKTAAGINRIIPIADKILPLIKNRYNPNRRYLVNNRYGNHYTYGSYVSSNFNTCINRLGMQHLPHDGRHTFASIMNDIGANEVCVKLIMGHSMKNDITKSVYTHKTKEQLLEEVNKM